jgi:hypothetical protein
MNPETSLLRRIKLFTWIFIVGLVLSGATAIPLQWELDVITKVLGISGATSAETANGLQHWLLKVREGLDDTYAKYPFIAYGTDWLAFGHFMIALVFVGALRDPVRNKWLYAFGMLACVALVPYALIMGQLRGIPIYWGLIDISFGVFGFIPVYLCHKWVSQVEALRKTHLVVSK